MIVAVKKPKGPSSFDIIAKARKITGVKKVGHAGTLDPLASGALVVAIGRESTKKISQIVSKEKEYIAKIKLGFESETDDNEGKKTRISSNKPSEGQIKEIINKYIGTVNQVPPIYSAIKVKGERAYKMARSGKVFELKSRPVLINSIKIVKYSYPCLQISIVCGPGVYIRSLARDIGRDLGVGAYLTDLVRTRVGEFKVEESWAIVKLKNLLKWHDASKAINDGKIIVSPTDTIYGILGKALDKKVVQSIYEAKGRNPEKPSIILISSISQLKLFNVKIGAKEMKILNKFWPGKISFILPCKSKKFEYLHRGTKTLAFRLPDKKELIYLIGQTGPLIAPSANPEGLPPAKNIKEAKRYFRNRIEVCVSGKTNDEPSTLVQFADGVLNVIRQGAIKIENGSIKL